MIDKNEIEQIKQNYNLIDYVGKRVILKRKGKQYTGLCPFHDDTQPSLVVDPRKQLWNCLGACQEGGDIYRWVMKLEQVDFRQAHLLLGGKLDDNTKSPSESGSTTEQSSKDIVEQAQWLRRAVDYYHQCLLENHIAQQYLHNRGISLAAIQTLKIGYVNSTLLNKLSVSGLQALQQLGLITTQNQELMSGCVVFPLQDALHQQVSSLYGRHIDHNQHLYLPGELRGIFNPTAAQPNNEIVIAESVIDAAALWSVGLHNSLAIYGINGLTPELLDHLKAQRVRLAYLLLDNDEAGKTAATKLQQTLKDYHITSHIITLPVKDPADFISQGGTLTQLHVLFGQAQQTSESSQTTDNTKVIPALVKLSNGSLHFSRPPRDYFVRGLVANELDKMRIHIRAKANEKFHLDVLDLYQDNARTKFALKAARQLQCSEALIEADLLQMIDLLEDVRLQLHHKADRTTSKPDNPMTAKEQEAALNLLKTPNLIDTIVEHIRQCGLIGEKATVLVGYLAALSRKLTKPLSLLIVARAGAGKTSLQEAICSFVPPEDSVWVTRLTGQALFYKDPNSLKGKVLAIAEEEGAAQAIYSLRTLASDQRLSIAVTQTNPQTGELHTKHYDIYGPVSILTTTTSPEAFDEETRSRFVLLTMDESAEQTKAILAKQRRSKTLAGVLEETAAEGIKHLHHNAQRLLKSLKVVNPYVEYLTFPTERLIARREQHKYLTLIDTIALLHQHQREIKHATQDNITVDYVEVEISDIALANELAQAVLWRAFDEMSPPVRGMLQEIKQLYQQQATQAGCQATDIALSRRQIREATQWTDWQVRVYCQKLIDMEYLFLAAASNGKPSLYKLIEPAEEIKPNLRGLIEVEALRKQFQQLKEKSAVSGVTR